MMKLGKKKYQNPIAVSRTSINSPFFFPDGLIYANFFFRNFFSYILLRKDEQKIS